MSILNDERCPFTWNPGVWPYVTRCSLRGHTGTHVDAQGRKSVDVPSVDAATAVVSLLTEPDFRGPSLHRDKLRTLAMEWPVLASALGALVHERGADVPSPLRRAMAVIAKEIGNDR